MFLFTRVIDKYTIILFYIHPRETERETGRERDRERETERRQRERQR